ncbi:hypothetical protein Ancab_002167 [Ancistrocladus abbreviatus]
MATSTLDEETSKKVIRQVEFYFSDSNLPRDKFLKKTMDESEDGMVNLALICSFSRMRNHLGLGEVKPDDVSEDTVKAVAETLRQSNFLKISDDGRKVGRITELAKPEEVIEQVDNRTIAASPLPYNVKLEDVEAFFTQFAKVNSVRLPHHVSSKKVFCGTALIEFSTEEDVEKILEQTLSYAGAELELKPKKDFDTEREKQAQETENSHPVSDHKSSEEADYPKGLIVAFTLKSISSESKQNDEPITNEVDASKTDGEGAGNVSEVTDKVSEIANNDEAEKSVDDNKENDNGESNHETEGKETTDEQKSSEDGNEKNEEKAASEEKPGAAGYKDNVDVVLREDLKAVFEKFGTVKYVDFKMGAESGYIRFEQPEAAQKARALAVLSDEGGLIVKNYIATLEPVTGEAEKEYWKFRDSSKGNKGRGGKHHRGGRHGWSRNGRPNKVQKVGA